MLVYVSFFILTFSGGVLSHCKPPKCNPEPECPENEHYTQNNPRCIRTCANKWVPTSDGCKPFTGCVCNDGLVRLNDDASGPCVPEHKCPCKNDPKKPNQGDQIITAHADALAYAEVAHQRKVSDLDGTSFGHYRSKSSSLSSSSSSYSAVLSHDCGGNKCRDPNAVFKECPNPCPLTCAEPNPRPCAKMCLKSGCECAPGFVLDEFTGRCIRPQDCPGYTCSDPNAVFKECPNPCPLTCAEPNPRPCGKMCLKTGCECAPGFVLDEVTGRCIRPQDCPGNKCNDPNAIYKECPNPCPLTCDEPFPKPCNKACLKSGCECAPGFILETIDKYGRCIRPSFCPEPISCPKHATYVMNESVCPPTCGNRMLPSSPFAGACVPFTGCLCDPGYVRKYDNATGPCILERKCPPIPTKCCCNETPTSCRTICPPQTCDSIYSEYYCLPAECEPGCDCLNGYLRNSDGKCIPSEDCFNTELECGENEVASDCAITCPPQSCDSLFTNYLCSEPKCEPGCNCIDGYLRNSLGICVPSDECYTDPAGCNGDVNAVRVRGCGSSCLPTCENPEPEVCTLICVLNACECKPGFILSDRDGYCVEPGECPGGSPTCGANKTYVGCKFGCPTNYCPADDSRGLVACSPPFICNGGCACEAGYLIVSRDDPRCVLSSDCPEVNCTRPNEVWDPSPSSCYFERCEDRGQVCEYPNPPGPRCVCEEGFYRNENETCIPESECPPLGCKGDLNATLTTCPTPCPKTCADPTAGDEGCIEICLPEGCQCNPGFVLTEENGVCIRLEDCPEQPDCNGDPNAVYSTCPSACEPTCANPDPQICTLQCLPSGCVCKSGFVLSEEGGKCIRPEQCPEQGCNGDPNAEFSTCPSACEPTCANPDPQICTLQCLPSGCVCKSGFVFSEESGKCIRPEQCPEQGCNGDPNAEFSTCPSACEPTCANPDPQICTLQCLPSGCVCKSGFVFSEESGKCIRPEQCPEQGCNGDPNAEFSTCPSACEPTCANPDPQICTLQCLPSGCVCKSSFVFSEESGKCIKPEECPVDTGCNGDMNATHSDCPSSCPITCENHNREAPMFCPAVCDPSFCACKPGFILTKKGGIGIKPEDCPEQGCQGDPNAEYSDCPSACQATCENPDTNQPCTRQCLPSGCVCKPGYIRIAEDGKCIQPEECSVLECNGDRNATFRDCTSACPRTCDDEDPFRVCPAVCMPPGCQCNSGYVLDNDGKCILPEDCPAEPECKGDRNATFNECPSACQATCKNPDTNGPCIDMCMPPGCVCKQGYLLTKSGGQCIRPEDCPGGSPRCGKNETYVYCYSGCPTDYCPVDDSRDFIACDPIFPCRGGCACKGGYLKLSEEDDRCILSSDCPQVECTRPNEIWDPNSPGCLHESCSNKDIPCDFQYLGPPRCVCIGGFYRNDDDMCVPEIECAPQGCNGDMNATYTECTSGCPLSCQNQYLGIACAAVCYPPGCQCNPGYLLDNDGKCILPEDCPAEPECKGDRNATFKECPSACQATCKNPDTDGPCIDVCLPPGCVCEPGYLLTKAGGRCIRPEDCPGGLPRCGKNETYVYCKVGCPTNYCPVDDSRAMIACDPPWPCPGGCACKEGYLINNREDDMCILSSECPEVECTRPNEVWDPNALGCLRESCYDKDTPCEFQYPGPPRCVCVEGFYRNIDDICVPEDECPPGCNGDMNATYTECTTCAKTCENKDRNEACLAVCFPPGCQCNSGYVLDNFGKCILPEDCPVSEGCNGDMNATYTECTTCATTCDNKDSDLVCAAVCYPPGCQCNSGYVLDNNGKCILPEDCPAPQSCDGDVNATFSECPSECPATCCEPDSDKPCITSCAEPGCVCNDGFIMSKPGGSCIRPYDCPGGSPKCCDNTTYVSCKIDCPMKYCPTNENEITIICDPVWPCPSGCACKPGYLMTNTADRTCILAADCPPFECTRPNEVWDPSPSNCNYERCDEMYYECGDTTPGRPRCVCIEGYYKDQNGVCIPAEECPEQKCGYNEVEVPCRQICPPQNCEIAYTDYACTNESKICEPGCDCLPNHLRNGSGICIPNDQCPYPSTPVCGINEIARDCRRICPPQSCFSKYALIRCKEDIPCEPGCDCVRGYLRDYTGKCIPSEKCPGPKPKCGYNEVEVPCRQKCPPQDCEIAYTSYACTNESKICERGCDCLPNHLRNASGICVPNDQCSYPSTPECGINEIARDCRRICPPQSCISKYVLFSCLADIPCEPGCDCIPGYLRDYTGKCIPSEKCPGPCSVADECKRTCAEPNPPNCPYNPPTENINGCDCKDGYILSELGGDCIPIDECPPDIACHDDPNARPKRCPKPCASTCQSPNQTPCKRMCEAIACECKPGFLLSNDTGRCILPGQCPGGDPCGKTGRFVDCKTDCPRDYCPVDDSRNVFCDPPAGSCLSGCICDLNHKKKSREDPTCIVSSDCPPINCTRPNETFSSCPSACLAENCEDVYNQPTVCNTLVLNCEPACICKKNHFRNSTGICIPAEDCPPGCNGDMNATYTECTTCPKTCENKDSDLVCPGVCYPPGCQCNSGYVLDSNGKCILPEDCPVC